MQSLGKSYETAKKNNNIKENDLSKTNISIHETKESNINEAILIRCLKFGLRKLVIKFKDQKFIQAMNNIEIIKEKDEEKKEKEKEKEKKISKVVFSVYLQMGERSDFLVFGGGKGIFLIYFNKNNILISKLLRGGYKGGIKINNHVFALTSNDILPNGENKIIFYDINKIIDGANGIIKEIKSERSFTVSTNSLAKMEMYKLNESEPMMYLLCGCKRYNNINQKNEILLIELKSYNEVDFYDTEDFEVYCFCPISMTLKNSDNNIELYPTNYFFVGGFDESKKRGSIKLFRLKENDDKAKIEYLQDIEFEQGNEYKFDMNVSCITQSKITGEILVTCWNGKIYKFSVPNIIYYLDYEYNKNKGYCYLKYDERKLS
jgi:hypothetical protein